jgi:leucyl aminopeptidase
MKTKIITDRITKIEDKVIVAGFFSDVRPLKGLAGDIDWLFNGEISRLILDGKLNGQIGDSLLLCSNRLKTRNVLLLGMGNRERFDSSAVKNTAKLLANKLSALNIKNFTTEIFGSGYSSLEASNVFKLMLSEFKKFDDIDVNFFVKDKEGDTGLGIKLKGILDS